MKCVRNQQRFQFLVEILSRGHKFRKALKELKEQGSEEGGTPVGVISAEVRAGAASQQQEQDRSSSCEDK